jgi:signal transduction histidine kinase
MHPDTLLFYADKAGKLASKQHDPHAEIMAMQHQAGALITKGLFDSAISLCNNSLDLLSQTSPDPQLESNLYNQKGRAFMRKNEYKEAIEMGYQGINAAEKANDILLQVKGKTLIGWAYLEMGQTKESLSWHLKAMRTATDTLLLEKYGIVFANLALNYNGLGQPDSAFYYINKAVQCSRKYENLFSLSNSLAIKAQLQIRAGRPALAEAPLKEVIEIRKMIGDPFYIVSDMSQLGLYYAHNGQPEKGIAICLEGIGIARQFGIVTKLIFLYSSLGECYKVMGNHDGYAKVLENIIALKDSIYEKNSADALARIQAKYELQKKENLIIRQNLDINRQRYLFIGLLLLIVFSSIVAWLLFRLYKKRQQLKLEKMQEEEKRLSMLAVSKAEENERKRIAADLHDSLGAYAASIASNLDQISLHRKDDEDKAALQELRNNSQAIVSQLNDTIWVLKKENLSLTAISDRLKVFIQRIRASYPKVNIDVLEQISSDVLMAPSQAFHLYQIAGEAVINALKHSQAGNIRIYIESNHTWSVTISDDGNGIASHDLQMASGNGISNMKSRVKEAGWQITWQKNDPKGTNVIIQPTTN